MSELATGAPRLKVWILFALLIVGGIGIFRATAASSPYEVIVPLSDANGLYPGSDVLIAGSRAGSVENIAVQGTHALVKLHQRGGQVDGRRALAHAPFRVGDCKNPGSP